MARCIRKKDERNGVYKIMKYVCELCGMVYDEAVGDEKRGVPAGTPFVQLPNDYDCPRCGSEKEAFTPAERKTRNAAVRTDDRAFWQNVKYSEAQGESDR